ncbi:MAG: ABC transporter permease subunit [Anaerolineaceae bacterium]|nr:ABC transporter permease subunit [Anaerolineaceae bacterium]
MAEAADSVAVEAESNGIAQIAAERPSQNLWQDAFSRLLRNHAAVLGLIIIILNFGVALFAERLAPRPYEKQVLALNNSTPQWIIDVFPSLEAKDETIRLRGAELTVQTGDRVAADQLLGESTVRGQTSEIRNRMAGTVIIEGNQLIITQEEVEVYDIRSGWEVFVADGDPVLPGDVLAQHRETAEQYVAQLRGLTRAESCQLRDDGTRPRLCVGTVYLTEEKLFVRNPNIGYVKVSDEYPLGADYLGRDMLSRLMYGAQISLAAAMIGSTVSLVLGVALGLSSGFIGGRVDNFLMRVVDIMYSFPTILLVIALMAFFRSAFVSGNTAVSLPVAIDATETTIEFPTILEKEFRGVQSFNIGKETVAIIEKDYEPEVRFILTIERGAEGTEVMEHAADANITLNRPWSFARQLYTIDNALGGMFFIALGIGFTSWAPMARLTRGQVLSIREREYVEAARSLGASQRRIMFHHIYPNILGPIVVAETLTIPSYIAYEAFLSFIGLGVNPPTPSWGAMISEGAELMRDYPYQALFPALALFFIMFAFNFLGDGLRDALDPRLRGVD